MGGDRSPMGRARAGVGTAIAVALCVLGWAAAPALADPAIDFAPGSAPMQQAQAIAQAYWGTSACAGTVTIAWASLAPTMNASSSWANPVAEYDAPAQNTQCSITFNSDQDWTWAKFCTVAVHEYGHLSGHPHSTDPNDVMYPFYETPVSVCAAAAKPSSAGPLSGAPPAAPRLQTVSEPAPARSAVIVLVRWPRPAHKHHHRHHAKRHHGAR
jgi:hypothetical protein